MNLELQKIEDQTIVITGATSGIGLTTARTAAEAGANVVLIARNEDALRELADEINSSGGQAIYFAADVADENALHAAANQARSEFGTRPPFSASFVITWRCSHRFSVGVSFMSPL